jgi:hypothetical protein
VRKRRALREGGEGGSAIAGAVEGRGARAIRNHGGRLTTMNEFPTCEYLRGTATDRDSKILFGGWIHSEANLSTGGQLSLSARFMTTSFKDRQNAVIPRKSHVKINHCVAKTGRKPPSITNLKSVR